MTRLLILSALTLPALITGCDTTAAQPARSTGPSAPIVLPDSPTDSPVAVRRMAHIPMLGTIPENEDVSGVGILGDTVFLVSDETAHVDVLKRSADGLKPLSRVTLGAGELDLEAIDVDGATVYVAGSHSRVRPKIKKKDDYAAIRQKLTAIDTQPVRDVIARFRFENGVPGPVETISLREAIVSCEELRPFADLPGKENGVDIEGLAVKGGKLFVGFRSPVLRANYLPVMVTTFETPNAAEIRFLNLGGLGIRDLVAVEDGFLILAGPPGDGPGSYLLYHWDGNDTLPGASPAGHCRPLGTVSGVEGKPEGITLVTQDDQEYELLVVCDGAKNGSPTLFRCRK